MNTYFAWIKILSWIHKSNMWLLQIKNLILFAIYIYRRKLRIKKPSKGKNKKKEKLDHFELDKTLRKQKSVKKLVKNSKSSGKYCNFAFYWYAEWNELYFETSKYL